MAGVTFFGLKVLLKDEAQPLNTNSALNESSVSKPPDNTPACTDKSLHYYNYPEIDLGKIHLIGALYVPHGMDLSAVPGYVHTDEWQTQMEKTLIRTKQFWERELVNCTSITTEVLDNPFQTRPLNPDEEHEQLATGITYDAMRANTMGFTNLTETGGV